MDPSSERPWGERLADESVEAVGDERSTSRLVMDAVKVVRERLGDIARQGIQPLLDEAAAQVRPATLEALRARYPGLDDDEVARRRRRARHGRDHRPCRGAGAVRGRGEAARGPRRARRAAGDRPARPGERRDLGGAGRGGLEQAARPLAAPRPAGGRDAPDRLPGGSAGAGPLRQDRHPRGGGPADRRGVRLAAGDAPGARRRPAPLGRAALRAPHHHHLGRAHRPAPGPPERLAPEPAPRAPEQRLAPERPRPVRRRPQRRTTGRPPPLRLGPRPRRADRAPRAPPTGVAGAVTFPCVASTPSAPALARRYVEKRARRRAPSRRASVSVASERRTQPSPAGPKAVPGATATCSRRSSSSAKSRAWAARPATPTQA